MSSTGTETVAQLCSRLVEEHFDEKPYEPFVLENFSVPQHALLSPMAKESTTIRRDPSTIEVNVPSLLLHNLPGHDDILEQYKQSDVYKFIEGTTDICSGLYGTSGAGKTRSIYEYLSHNFGFYFVANTDNDPGSKDLGRLVTMFSLNNPSSTLESLTDDNESQFEQAHENMARRREQRSVDNYVKMDRCVSILIHVRAVIFEAIKKVNPRLTPFDWLMIQLYPERTMKKDLFSFVFGRCYNHALERPRDISALMNLQEQYDEQESENEWPWSVMVVDEAQALLHKLTGFFLCGKAVNQRTAFSAVLKGMVNVLEYIETKSGYPLVAGTGMQIEHIREASNSITAKRPHALHQNRRTIFQTFKPLDADGVKKYLNDFLSWNTGQDVGDDQTPDDCVFDHVAKWLRGRPRWAASFLELYLVRAYDNSYVGTRGSFSPEGGRLIQALDRFLLNYTTGMAGDVYKGDRSGERGSYEPPEGTALGSFFLAEKNVRYEVMKELESAIFKFSVGGKAAYVNVGVAGLIEVGVAALSHEDYHRCAVLDEPIMIQAGINYFSMEKLAKSNMTKQEEEGVGDAFEKLLIPAIQRKFPEILRSQLGKKAASLDGYAVSCRSSYGVLAEKCNTPLETIQWIDDAASSTFEGQVVPFCYPDTAFGPDLVFMLRNDDYRCCVFAISQAKYRNDINQLEALRNIAPFLLYHQNRGKENQQLSPLISSDDLTKKRWEEVRPKLVGGKRGCVRFMVQYPCEKTRSATPGVIEDDQATVQASNLPDKKVDKTKRNLNVTTTTAAEGKPKKLKEAQVETADNDPKQERKLGWLVTIDKNNASSLFGHDSLEH